MDTKCKQAMWTGTCVEGCRSRFEAMAHTFKTTGEPGKARGRRLRQGLQAPPAQAPSAERVSPLPALLKSKRPLGKGGSRSATVRGFPAATEQHNRQPCKLCRNCS